MSCSSAREILQAWIDGELSPELENAREHLNSCLECREWMESMEGLVAVLSAGERPRAIPDLSGAIMASLPERRPSANVALRRVYQRVAMALVAAWLFGALSFSALFVFVRNDLPGLSAMESVTALRDAVARSVQSLPDSADVGRLVSRSVRLADSVWRQVGSEFMWLLGADLGLLLGIGGCSAYAMRRPRARSLAA